MFRPRIPAGAAAATLRRDGMFPGIFISVEGKSADLACALLLAGWPGEEAAW